jgi:TRAP-type C4-dicarboxylate transport system permease small subunit
MSDPATGPIGRLNGRVTTWLARIAAFALAALAVMTFCDVIARYAFNKPFSFTVEITEIMMGVLIYFGVGLVTQDNDHISVDIVTLRLSNWWRALFSLVTNVLAFGFLVLLVWRLWDRALVLLEKGDVSPVMFIPRWPTAVIMAVGAIFFLTGLLVHIVGAFKRLTGEDLKPPAPPSERPYTE